MILITSLFKIVGFVLKYVSGKICNFIFVFKSNTDLELKMRSQLKVIEKLKKENVELRKCARKSKLHPEDKENIGSPNRSLNSSRVESPFRERN